ncbi:rhodanese-like domain-containing protein [Sphingomonas segetis]|jgi:rhodanese-related sulfurtransferase|uniref:rhodanese-like domain-containing protein n=1 Tax=Sphingomonas segetis TaxID=1104779 RepID=UPI0012D2A88B|nr:rhodanese-like domain-containing protein [Sphingomonas segetis]
MPSLQEMLSSANDEVPKVTAEEAHELISGRDALLLDVRDAPELAQQGKLKGAVNVSRGMLEFRADPNCSYHDPEFRKDRPVVLYCASGGRSALAGKTLRDMGYAEVYNLGSFKDAAQSGFPSELQ